MLEKSDCCGQAVTLKFDDRRLVSFISPGNACPKKAKAKVEAHLPYYCTPSLILPLPSLLKTPRGKIDKRLLLQLASERLETAIAGAAQ